MVYGDNAHVHVPLSETLTTKLGRGSDFALFRGVAQPVAGSSSSQRQRQG